MTFVKISEDRDDAYVAAALRSAIAAANEHLTELRKRGFKVSTQLIYLGEDDTGRVFGVARITKQVATEL